MATLVHDDSPESLAFAAKTAFTRTGHGDQTSRLDVGTANVAGFEDAESRILEHGIRIVDLTALPFEEEDFMRQVHRLDMETHRDVPTVIPFGEIEYQEWLDAVVNGAGRSPRWAWVAMAGVEPVGLARLRIYESERAAQNAYTGVHSEYRGLGVARALKYRTIEWCRENGIDFIYTGNDIKNDRMLAINIPLGYQSLPCEIEVAKDLLG